MEADDSFNIARRTADVSGVSEMELDEESLSPPATPEKNARESGNCTPEKKVNDNVKLSLGLVLTPQTPRVCRALQLTDESEIHQFRYASAMKLRECILSTPSPNTVTTQKITNRVVRSAPAGARRPEVSESNYQEYESPFGKGRETASTNTPWNKAVEVNHLYESVFIQIDLIGAGCYGSVYKCLNKTNGCYYAVKRLARGLAKRFSLRRVSSEIYAHGLFCHKNIVRNYFSWREGETFYIQNELCEGGSLDAMIQSEGGRVKECEISRILLHVSNGLSYIHSKNLAHNDIKSSNIFIAFVDPDCTSYVDDDDAPNRIIYKIGDLGHVCPLEEAKQASLEGDCRYLSKEMLNKCACPEKADMFSLGMTAYEAAGNGPLPLNGDDWHALRLGSLDPMDHLCSNLARMIRNLLNVDPAIRPSAREVYDTLHQGNSKRKLEKELKANQHAIEVLHQKIQDAEKCVLVLKSQSTSEQKPQTSTNNSGKKIKRNV